jgi:5'(3')-deoxyribonucleotidase
MQLVRYRIQESGRLKKTIDEHVTNNPQMSSEEIQELMMKIVMEHEQFVMSEMKRYSMLKSGLCVEDIPDIVFQNAVYCELENDIHRSGYLSVFGYYLEKFGYNIEFEDIVTEESTVKPDEYADPTSAYDTTPMIDQEEYKHYRKCIMKGKATKDMKQAAWKYEFEIMLYVDRLSNEDMKILFDAMHNNSANRIKFDRVYIETHQDVEEVLTKELDRVKWVELLSPICEVISSVRNICEIFGLKNSIDTKKTFTTEDIYNNLELLDKELCAVKDKLKFRYRSTQKELSVAKVRSMLKAFFGAWSGMTLESVSEIRTKNDHIITYSLFPKDVFSKTLKNISGR